MDSLDLVDYIIEGTDDDGLEELDQSTASRLMAVADKLASEKEELITQNLEALQYQVEMQSLLTIVGGPVKFRIEHVSIITPAILSSSWNYTAYNGPAPLDSTKAARDP